MIIPILLLFPVPPVAGETLRGFHFLDNKVSPEGKTCYWIFSLVYYSIILIQSMSQVDSHFTGEKSACRWLTLATEFNSGVSC